MADTATYTPEQIATAVQAYRNAPQPTVDQPPPESAGPQQPIAPWDDPSNLQAAEFGRHFTEETDDPLGAAGERGEPIQQTDPVLADRISKAVDAYRAAHGPNPLLSGAQRMLEFPEVAGKRAIEDIGTMGAGAIGAAASLTDPFAAPSLVGKSVDQVQAIRAQMVQEKATVDQSLDSIMGSGQVSVADGGGAIAALATRSSNLAKQIQNADGIIASGQSQFTDTQANPLTAWLRGSANSTPAATQALDNAFPTNADFTNSFAGKIATIGADAVVLGGANALGVGLPAMAAFTGGQTYQDAKKNGASDQDAENAALIDGITTIGTAPIMDSGIALLAKKFAGLTPKEGIADIISAVTHIGGSGATMSAFQIQSNAIAKLSGYDPNRPLDQGVWQSFWTGIGFGAFSQALDASPRLSGMNQPDVTVRNKPGTPPDTGSTPEENATPPVAPTAATPVDPNVPRGTVTPTEPLQSATTNVQENVGAAPEQVLANAGDPHAALLNTINSLAQIEPEPTVPAVQAQTPSVQSQAEAQIGTPLDTADQLAQAHAQIVAEMEDHMRQDKEQAPQIGTAPTPEVPTEPAAETITPTTPTENVGVIPETPSTPAVSRPEGFEVPVRASKRQVLTPDQQARWDTWDSLSTADQTALRANDPAAIDRFNRNVAEQTAALEANKPWYESGEFASRTGQARPEIPETPIDQAGVKREVNNAQVQMGMEDHLHYVPTVEALPDRVKNGLTTGERNGSAQIVRDNKLGDIYVVGDRFSGTQELRRAIIEETQPYMYRNVSDLQVTHDPTDDRLGHYDIVSDRPTLNTHALLRTDNPFESASKTALEEVNVHQGFTKLLGPRNGKTYVDAMNSVQRNFDRLKLNDILAQKKGFKDLGEMAKKYGFEDYKTNPRSQHALTEELIGAYAQTFKTPDGLAANAPVWYQTALRSLNNAIRGRLGLKLQDIDIQHLLADSASALRYPKYGQEGMFHPEIDAQSKDDMAQFQLANRTPEEAGAGAAGEGGEGSTPPETANIGTEIVRSTVRGLQRNLAPGEALHQQSVRLAFDESRSFRERMGLIDEQSNAVYNIEGDAQVHQMAQAMFDHDLGGNVNTAMDYLTQYRQTGAINPILGEIVTRRGQEVVNDMVARGYGEQAKLLEAKLDRFNQDVVARSADVAREQRAAQFRTATGASVAAGFKNKIQEIQARFTGKKGNAEANGKVKEGLNEVKKVNEAAAGELSSNIKEAVQSLQDRIDANAKRLAEKKPPTPGEPRRPQVTTKSLPEQYTEDLVKRIDDALNKVAPVKDRAPLEKIFDTFRRNITQVVKERVDLPEQEKPPKPTAMDTLRQMMSNYPAYEQAWRRTVDALQTTDPKLYADLNRAVAEPVGQELAGKLATEHGVNLSDLIYNHYSNVDRINRDLATQISAATGLSGADATRLADHLQSSFTDIVKTKQASRLQQILNAVGQSKNGRPGKGELAQLVDHISIGSLDNKEWLNTVAPRFGISNYTPESIAGLKQAGDLMMKMRDDGLSNSVIAQKVRQQISDYTQIDPNETALQKQSRYALNVYTAGLLTGPLTHIPYWQQNVFVGAMDSLFQGIRVMSKTRDVALTHQMFSSYWQGILRGMEEFKPSLQQGFRQMETPTWEGREGEHMLGSNELDKMQLDAKNPYTWYGQYKYVRNFLEAISNLMGRGTEYAMLRANYAELAHDRGLSTADAWKYAEEGVYGSTEQQAQAHDAAQRYAQQYNLNQNQATMLENEILDQYKTQTMADLPDTMLGDEERFQREDVARRAVGAGVRSTLRGEVYGVAGGMSRRFISFGQENPWFRLDMPFMKVPFNLINELTAWTPVGMVRGRSIESIRNYVKNVPGMEARMDSDFGTPENFSEAQLNDLRYNQMVKGILGSVAAGAIGTYINGNLNNPNPFVRLTYTGPSSYGQQQIEQAKGWQPNSVKIGDHWFSYENTPFRSMLAALGAYEDFRRYEKQPDDLSGVISLSAFHMLHGAVSSLFGSPLQGLTSLFDFTNKQGGPNIERSIGNFLTQVIAAVPSTLIGGTGVRQLYRAAVPQEYEANDYVSKLYRNIPVVNTMFLQPKLNVLGEPLNRNPINNDPIIPTNVPNDPVWQFLAHHDNIKLSMPGNQGKVDQIKMTPQEVYENHKARGPALKAMIADAINDPSFVNGTLDDQNAQIKSFEEQAKYSGDQAVRDYRDAHPKQNPNEEQEPEE